LERERDTRKGPGYCSNGTDGHLEINSVLQGNTGAGRARSATSYYLLNKSKKRVAGIPKDERRAEGIGIQLRSGIGFTAEAVESRIFSRHGPPGIRSLLPAPRKEMDMEIASTLIGASLVMVILWEAFETIIFPRRVTRRLRLTRIFYRMTWRAWRGIVSLLSAGRERENLLSIYGPISLIMLISLWAFALILGFGLVQRGAASISQGQTSLATNLYFSGTNFFTLGLGDIQPASPFARLLAVVEAGTGLGFLAIIIGYLPGLNQSFSRREVNISLLDARAGSPPTAAEILYRHRDEHGMESIRQLLSEWERWSAELLESHLSYPVLAYFRSQHDNQSWLASLAAILDTSAFVMVGLEGACTRQAQLTFAIARHAVVDLSLIFGVTPGWPKSDRLPPDRLEDLRSRLMAAGLQPRLGDEADQKLLELRGMYEPFIFALSTHFRLALPPWIMESAMADNWQTSISMPAPGGAKVVRLPRRRAGGHF